MGSRQVDLAVLPGWWAAVPWTFSVTITALSATLMVCANLMLTTPHAGPCGALLHPVVTAITLIRRGLAV